MDTELRKNVGDKGYRLQIYDNDKQAYISFQKLNKKTGLPWQRAYTVEHFHKGGESVREDALKMWNEIG